MKSKSGDITVFPDNSYDLMEYFTGPPSKLHLIFKGPLRVVNHVGSTYRECYCREVSQGNSTTFTSYSISQEYTLRVVPLLTSGAVFHER
jgi:hypothetical protein